ncbi:VOC family protein [uncultured Polaribacter sp.]|uniref:VOC family protein n=1 Tax=uncultured Polaribacter sp. TaxID=174711 RepID=UPI00261A5BF8|nr:VOC family protein [uncultured Polaribacter sp.]
MKNNQINYIEFKSNDIQKTKEFYSTIFNWKFTDYGPNYVAFSQSGLEGGFEFSSEKIINGCLVVLYADNLKIVKEKIISFGGIITKEIFKFPGGKRFHFLDITGNELAVWSEE